MSTKTDNRSLDDKLALRDRILGAARFDGLRVLDLCADEGRIWQHMGRRWRMQTYVPCDEKPRMPGVIQGRAERLIQSFDLAKFNVIDIDTYGEPWEIAELALPKISARTALFLTHGVAGGAGGTNISKLTKRVLGIPDTWTIPTKAGLAKWASWRVLRGLFGHYPVASAYRVTLERVIYYGLLLDP